MKIGILTQRIRGNYGGVLQNYALQYVLKEFGHIPITIDEQPVKFRKDILYYLRVFKRLLLKVAGNKKVKYISPQKYMDVYMNPYAHSGFVSSKISRIFKQYPLSPSITQEEGFDCYIVGSDQVWRPDYQTNLGNCFLDFTSHQEVKRGAYAASFGVDNWMIDTENTRLIKHNCQKFDMITVREDVGVKLCQDFLSVKAKHVLDPTMLLTATHYRELYSIISSTNKSEVIVYLLDENKEKCNYVNRYCSLHGKKCEYIGKVVDSQYDSIESWLHGIDNADYVITDSFHGAVFSIIFNKQFVVFGNKERGQSRFLSLLRMFGLEDRLIGLDSEIDSLQPINYDKINNILSIKKEESLKVLIEFLK